MRWLILFFSTWYLTACGLASTPVVETRDIIVPQKVSSLEFGDNCTSIDVTNTTIRSY